MESIRRIILEPFYPKIPILGATLGATKNFVNLKLLNNNRLMWKFNSRRLHQLIDL